MSNMRIDRALSVGLVHPVSRLLHKGRAPRVPILMYHSIRPTVGGRHPYFETNTSPESFARQMKYLHDNGYVTVDLNEAVELVMTGRSRQNVVAITFDDGFRDFYTHAFPVLANYGFKATMFIVSGLTTPYGTRVNDREYLSWPQVRELHSCGVRIGSHSVTHPELVRLNPRDLEYEIRESKEVIEDNLGSPIRSFAYPYAFPEQDTKFVQRLKELLQIHGYENGVSTIIGTASVGHDWYFLPRLPVNGFDDPSLLMAKLDGAYDWLHYAQRLYKTVFRRVAA